MAAIWCVMSSSPSLARGETSLNSMSSGVAGNQIQMLGLLAVLAMVPFAIMMVTSFSKIVVVLSIVRSALGTQQAPPTMVLTGLAAVLSMTVMQPTVEKMWQAAKPYFDRDIAMSESLETIATVIQPLKAFMQKHASADDRDRFVDMARELRAPDEAGLVADDDASIVLPAFVVTELREAFVIGFLIFLPFLIIDMLTANVLLALGMQSLSPSQISLPLKILLFVAIDGWTLLSRGLILGYR